MREKYPPKPSSSPRGSSSGSESRGTPTSSPVDTTTSIADEWQSPNEERPDSLPDEVEVTSRDVLRSWAVSTQIPLQHLTTLLKALRRMTPEELYSLPLDARTLLGGAGNLPPIRALGGVAVRCMVRPQSCKHRLKNKDSVAVLKDDNGVEITENSEKTELLGQYFASVFTRETEFRSHSASNAVETAGPVLDSILFPTAVVERELKNLKEAKCSGPDNIPAKFLKELANELSKPLAHIFRSSFELGRLPSEWKTANIFPIYKGGARTNANNYRPVSLTCICCKIMEAIVKKATMEFLEQGHLLSDLQNGFRQNRSCLSSLLLSTEQWTRALDEDGRVDVIYTDFKKAFDSVPHKRLIYKLSEIGIRGRLLTWITDFLTGRSQTVCIETSTSTPTPVVSGVPQGSVLGPLLFLVYINDCVDDLGCSAILFADDVKLWRPIRSDADRQLRGDLIQTYRIVRSRECALDFDDFFELAGTDRLRGHPFKLQRKRAHSDVRRNAFSQRVIGAWNGLPDAVVLSESVKSFKCRLDAHF
ncbi:hypothetical protein SprV_0200526100 [Sparganum proliferum]